MCERVPCLNANSSINIYHYSLRAGLSPDGTFYRHYASLGAVNTYSQLYRIDSPILTEKHVAPFKQYHFAYASGQAYVWNVMLGRVVGDGGRGFGVLLDEQASKMLEKNRRSEGKICLLLVVLRQAQVAIKNVA